MNGNIKSEEFIVLRDVLDNTSKNIIPGFYNLAIDVSSYNTTNSVNSVIIYCTREEEYEEVLMVRIGRFFDTFKVEASLLRKADLVAFIKYESVRRENIIKTLNEIPKDIENKLETEKQRKEYRKEEIKNIYLRQLEEL